MPHRRVAGPRSGQRFEAVHVQPMIPRQAKSRQGVVFWACNRACRLSAPFGSLHGVWPIAAWSDAS
jgi:hypothetical protein